MITAADIQAKLEQEWESDRPDVVLDVLRRHEGKQLTKRLLAKLPGGEAEWFIRHVAGMTCLEDRAYTFNREGNAGISLLMAYRTTNVEIDTKFIVEYNTGYFSARVARMWEKMTKEETK